MTSEQAKIIIRSDFKRIVDYLLTFVNLSRREREVLRLRHMEKITQESTAEEMNVSKNSIQAWEYSAIDKCANVWTNDPAICVFADYFLRFIIDNEEP